MYSHSENHAGGTFTSSFTGKAYRFSHTTDGSDKKRALGELRADHRIIERRLEIKLGRAPTLNEMREGQPSEDPRDLREKIVSDGSITSNPGHDSSENPYTSRIAELQSQTPLLRQDKAARDRRIKQLKKASADWGTKQAKDATIEKEANRIASDVTDAKATVALCRYGTGYTPEECSRAERMLSDLESSHDVKIYRKARDEFSADVKSRRNQAAQQLETQAEEQRTLAEEIRSGEETNIDTNNQGENNNDDDTTS